MIQGKQPNGSSSVVSRSVSQQLELLRCHGATVWISHPQLVWQKATVKRDYHRGDHSICVINESGTVVELLIEPDCSNLPPMRCPILEGPNNLTALPYLHEPSILNNLKIRFRERQIIYTYCGMILVAINPYAELQLYEAAAMRAYRGRSIGELKPHIFAVAEKAYTELEQKHCNLSIIVSGESGAGKTVSAKYVMRYFAAVGGSESETQVERRVLASSPIMEAFGNAKTLRNDNSSRFGKFIKLLFKNNLNVMNLSGATMHTYLLEKSRVVIQARGERSYHIFYQLCSSRHLYPELKLDHPDKFGYLSMGQSPDNERVSDKDQFKDTFQSMRILGFTEPQIADILSILAGILHLGNIRFMPDTEMDTEVCEICPNDKHLQAAAEVLKISSKDLRQWLKIRKNESVKECVLIPKSKDSAQVARDALSKHIYSKLFQCIVQIINKNLNTESGKQNGFIGVLDIYGFEKYENSSFEQFCINYANEKLQQQFIQRVFKSEQEDYLNEGIAWTMIDFCDNQPCIDLIETRLGVLSLLDEECKIPKGSDENWAAKLIEKCNEYPHFKKPRFGTTSFVIKHFSDVVEYNAKGFLAKNRDTVPKELIDVIRQSKIPLCKQLMEVESVDNSNADGGKGEPVAISVGRQQAMQSKRNRCSVGSQFKKSLSSLISTLDSTTPLYVRCINPNDNKVPFKWEEQKIVQQLRACGVLETVRISAEGFPSRLLYLDLYRRFQLLCQRSLLDENNLKKSCHNIVTTCILDEDKYRFGKTKIFFRSGQVCILEQMHSDLRKKYIVVVQSVVRRFIFRRRYNRLRNSAFVISKYVRSWLLRRRIQQYVLEAVVLKRTKEAIAVQIQRFVRGYLARRTYEKMRRNIIVCQSAVRGFLARRTCEKKRRNIIICQSTVRGFLARRTYEKNGRNIIICQSAVRGFLARRTYGKKRRNIIICQSAVRGFLARRTYGKKRRNVIICQSAVRGFLARRTYGKKRRNIIICQSAVRGFLARRTYEEKRRNIIICQCAVRGFLGRRTYGKKRRNIIICQSAVRGLLARQYFKGIKIKAHIQKRCTDLESKIRTIQKKIDDWNQETDNSECETCGNCVIKIKIKVWNTTDVTVNLRKPASAGNSDVPDSLYKQPETELRHQINDLHEKLQQLHNLFGNFDNIEIEKLLEQNECYLRSEVQRLDLQFTQLQNKMNTTHTVEQHKFTLLKDRMAANKSARNCATSLSQQKGMIKFRREDLDEIMKRLFAMRPTNATERLPDLPAYILFMCIRYTDMNNADVDVRDLFTKLVLQVKSSHISAHGIKTRALFLVNALTLSNLLKQYGDVEECAKYNTEKQMEQQMINFNLHKYRLVLLQVSTKLYQKLVKQIENILEPCIEPAVLLNDELYCRNQVPSMRPRPRATDERNLPNCKVLIQKFEMFYNQFKKCGLDSCYMTQIFHQLMYFICAVVMNSLMLRCDICWKTGMIIQHNLTIIQKWVRSKDLESYVMTPLVTLNQAARLLLLQKTAENVKTICEVCPCLSKGQILKILQSYKLDDYEEHITNALLEQLTEILDRRAVKFASTPNKEFMMDQKLVHPFKPFFKVNKINLEDIDIPAELKVDSLLEKM